MQSQVINKLDNFLQQKGVRVNGDKDWDLKIINPNFYKRIMLTGNLGLGESYMQGWWECRRLDLFFTKILEENPSFNIENIYLGLFVNLCGFMTNLQRRKPYQIGEFHYDLGNGFYEEMLGKTMNYSCGYWKDAKTLDQAQEAKMDLICKKLYLEKGQKLLDVGCGWGTFAKYAAQHYGVSVVGLTVSRAQEMYAKKICLNLPVEIKYLDYRKLVGKFDKIVSIGMFEHVGYKNYRTFMKIMESVLSNDGLFLLHTIGSLRSLNVTDPWIQKYIFPNSILPSLKQISSSVEDLFVIEDVHNFGVDYDKTLMSWYNNFEFYWTTSQHIQDERFYRMWQYYLLLSAALFRTRKTQLWQIILSKGGKAGYQSIR